MPMSRTTQHSTALSGNSNCYATKTPRNEDGREPRGVGGGGGAGRIMNERKTICMLHGCRTEGMQTQAWPTACHNEGTPEVGSTQKRIQWRVLEGTRRGQAHTKTKSSQHVHARVSDAQEKKDRQHEAPAYRRRGRREPRFGGASWQQRLRCRLPRSPGDPSWTRRQPAPVDRNPAMKAARHHPGWSTAACRSRSWDESSDGRNRRKKRVKKALAECAAA